jgi:hypothetical protein
MKHEISNWFRRISAEKAEHKPALQESASKATALFRNDMGPNDGLFSSNFKSRRNTDDAPNTEQVLPGQPKPSKRAPSLAQKTFATLRS